MGSATARNRSKIVNATTDIKRSANWTDVLILSWQLISPNKKKTSSPNDFYTPNNSSKFHVDAIHSSTLQHFSSELSLSLSRFLIHTSNTTNNKRKGRKENQYIQVNQGEYHHNDNTIRFSSISQQTLSRCMTERSWRS
ncbi:hypothetical protein NE237_004077 [Protea cynaroides]|uniref:Uncharacterized protein n=1 Tax=Protea cynaroides TaxID=273540 RepID=A0A9Q0QT73_9MAGN|nr:hypothetical protein NE237_004077 [Protea cynaroides]